MRDRTRSGLARSLAASRALSRADRLSTDRLDFFLDFMAGRILEPASADKQIELCTAFPDISAAILIRAYDAVKVRAKQIDLAMAIGSYARITRDVL